jgi:hypothetical protein
LKRSEPNTVASVAGSIGSVLIACWSSPESAIMRWSMTDASRPNL